MIFPNTVTFIDDKALEHCYNLQKADFSLIDSAFIEDNAFQHCKSLDSIKIPSKIGFFRSYIFYGCINLKHMDLTEAHSLRAVGSYSLAQCTSLSTIDFSMSPFGQIRSHAFYNDSSLTHVTFPADFGNIYV